MTGRPSILQKIYADKRVRLEEQKVSADFGALQRKAEKVAGSTVAFRLSKALSVPEQINVIAEFKRASPSKGVINGSASPADKAAEYSGLGAAAISVLTEEAHFLGSAEDLVAVRKAVPLPVLRKDFVFELFQVLETRAIGADAVLLIAAMLSDAELRSLMKEAESLGLDSLVEVHSETELERAVESGARLIGVNNRNLNTFEVSLDHSRELIRHKPQGVLMISESGISSFEQIEELRGLGFDGFLIGEALMNGASVLGTNKHKIPLLIDP